MAVISGVAISIMFFASIAYLESQAQMMSRTAYKTDRRIVLDGLYAYTVNAVKQSWCLSSNWVADINCTLNHNGNTQRLLLSDESLFFIKNSGVARPADPLSNTKLSVISARVDFSKLSSTHPLYSIVLPLKEEYSYGDFKIERDSAAISAVRGREIPIKITVFLKHKSDPAYDQTLVSKNIVYPRELSYFTLMVPNNLYLGTGSNNVSQGFISLPNISVNARGGLRFESPVFINGDLHLPASTTRPAMNNVIFVDKVFLGGGKVNMDGKLFAVKAAGGDDNAYNYELANFSGLMNGFELDPDRDSGLDYLFNLVPGGLTSFDAARLCRARLMASYDLSITNGSQLFARANSASDNGANISLNIGNVDNFIEQDGVSGYEATTTVPGVAQAALSSSSTVTGKPVMKAKVYYNGLNVNGSRGAYSTDFYIHRSGTVTLYPTGAGGPAITIQTSPLKVGSRDQYNQVDMSFSFGNVDIAPYNPSGSTAAVAPSIKFVFEAYDYAYLDGENVRPPGGAPYYKTKVNGVTFTKIGSNIRLQSDKDSLVSGVWYSNSGLKESTDYSVSTDPAYIAQHVPSPTDQDLAQFDDKCFATPEPGSGADFSAFPAATWTTDFAPQARRAWSFNPNPNWNTGSVAGEGTGYTTTEQLYSTNIARFYMDSLAARCTVGPGVTLLAGFFTCETFTIQARTTPLRIIGTVITNQLNIASSAYQAGIRWSNIYHPQATQELINAGILGRAGTVNCNPGANAPLWQANIGITSRYNNYVCNAISLRQADPFKWTMVDPDCGLVNPTRDTSPRCKKKNNRFLIKEVSRGKGL
jgi:hypothetical protein